MNTFSDLSRRVGDLDAPALDLGALVAAGERRLRRRRLVGAAAGAAMVAVLTVGGMLANAQHTQTSGPIDLPNLPRPTEDQVPTSVTRQVVYAGGLNDPTIYYGDRELKVRTGYVHLDLTDDGFIFTTPGPFQKPDPTVWFSDGGEPERIGRHCGQSSQLTPNDVMTGSSGSLVVWLECPEPGAVRDLVGYDTSLGREVLRQPLPGCDDGTNGPSCELTAIDGEHVYLVRDVGKSYAVRGVLVDLATGDFRNVTPRYLPIGGYRQSAAYLDDLRSQPRALVVGDTFASGTITDGIGLGFVVTGSRLVPLPDPEGPVTGAYATTGRAVRLHIPPGYDRASKFSLAEWLDDDTFALATGGQGPYSGDVLTCHLSDGHCDQAVKGPGSDTGVGQRLFPQSWLPA